jgi:CRISPR-associated endonuclease Csn1
VLYHLGQRRGFLSNRKTGKQDEDKSVVYRGISELRGAIEATGSQSLGEYFSRLDPTSYEPTRIRGVGRWTHRNMFEEEFERIWQAQARHWPEVLTKSLKKRVRRAIFYQRPLKGRRNWWESAGLRRPPAPAGARVNVAPCRMSSRSTSACGSPINHLRIESPGGEERPLTDEQRRELV